MFIRTLFARIRSQKLITVLMIFGSVLTAFVICFSYGVYHNYNTMINVGDNASRQVYILGSYSVAENYMDRPFSEGNDMSNEYTSMTKGDITAMLAELKPSTKEQIKDIFCTVTMTDDVYGLMVYAFSFRPTDGGLVSAGDWESLFTENQYLNGEHIAIVDDVTLNEEIVHHSFGTMEWSNEGGRKLSIGEEIQIGAERFRVLDVSSSRIAWLGDAGDIYIPFSALPDDTPIRDLNKTLLITFNKNVNLGMYNDIKASVAKTMGGRAEVSELDISTLTDLRYFKSIILIAVCLSVLSAITLSLLFKFMIERDRRRMIIFRVCGCSRRKTMCSSVLESLILTAPAFLLTELIFYKMLIPKLETHFTYIAEFFSPFILATIFVVFLAVTVLCISAMLFLSVGKRLDLRLD